MAVQGLACQCAAMARASNMARRPAVGTQHPSRFMAFGLAGGAEPLTPGPHVVATPIGNLKDISFRALGTLAAADALAELCGRGAACSPTSSANSRGVK